MKIIFIENIKDETADRILDSLRKSKVGASEKTPHDDDTVNLTVIVSDVLSEEYIDLLDELYPNPAEENTKKLATLDVRERLLNLRQISDAYYEKQLSAK